MTDVTNALEAVAALIGERTKYEGWIAALATKSDVPSHVLDKVRTDYTERLRGVLQAFTAHTPALEASLAELQARDASMADQEKECRDQFAEGELRHMVGEYDSEQWDQVRVGHEALLARLASEREGIAQELDRVKHSVAASADAAQRAHAISHPPEVAAHDEAVPSPQPTPLVGATVTPPSDDEFIPLYRDAPTAPAVSTERRPAPDDDLGFLRAAQGTPSPGAASMPEPATTATAMRSPETPMLRIVPNTPPPVASPTPSAAPDAAKTLKCAECGTMNYPSEWYCERCGGELAVL